MDRIEGVLKEERVFYPSEEFRKQAHIGSEEEYQRLYEESLKDPEGFWGRVASELHWFEPWQKVLEGDLPHPKWFVGGKTNLSYNALDRHVKTWRRNKAALIWEGEPGEERVLTYYDLWREVQKFASVLKRLGVEKGDRVTIYLPMIPEAAIAMLACTRIGAVHSVVFGGFSSGALADRIKDAQAKVLITADGGYRRGGVVPLKDNADEALKETPSVQHVVVVRRTGQEVAMTPGRDHWWHELMEVASDRLDPEPMEAEEPLFILYTSGSTGKPKGVLHTLGGYMTYVYLTTKLVFDLKDEDVHWCTADVGWITGHSYVVYGPLLNGATTVMYEGAPNWPEPDRFWQIVDKYGVSVLYTAPTAIRAFMKWGEQWPLKHRLDTLRLLGTVGEPINPEAWLWYYQVIGKGRCPIVDTWWQTETGGMMIAPLPGATTTTPGTATRPLPGISADIRTKDGHSVGVNEGGYLVLTRPWPAMLRTIWGDDERYRRQYWSEIEGVYFAGDGARRDEHGNHWIMGRVDDVINVSGHRLGTAEIESALVSHEAVAEAAVVGRPDDLKGSAIVAFVTLQGSRAGDDTLRAALREHVAKEIGALAKPDDIRFTDALPKTRSGKIMRRLLREIAASGNIVGDVTTLEDFSVLEKLRTDDEA